MSKRWQSRIVLAMLLCLLPLFDCNQPTPGIGQHTPTTQPVIIERIVQVPLGLIDPIFGPKGVVLDPTGLRGTSQTIDKATEEAAAKIRQVNVSEFNRTVRDLRASIALLHDRIESLPPDWSDRILREVESAELKEISARFQAGLDQINAKVEAVDTGEVNEAIADLRRAIGRLDAKIAAVDVDKFNEIIGEAGLGITDSKDAFDEMRFPLHVAFWLINGLLVVLMFAAIVYILRRRPHHDTRPHS